MPLLVIRTPTGAVQGALAQVLHKTDQCSRQGNGMTDRKEEAGQSVRQNIGSLDILRIMEMIPHCYPMMMIDRVRELVPDVRAVGLDNDTIIEAFVQGHLPRQPVMA